MKSKKIDNETILEILDYWLEDFSNYLKIPPSLKDKISKKDIVSIIRLVKKSYYCDDRSILPQDFDKLRGEILQRIKTETEIKSIKKTEEFVSKQIEIQEETKNLQKNQTKIISKQTLFIGISVFIAVTSLFFAIWMGYHNVNLMEKQGNLIDKQLDSISPLKPNIEVSLDFPSDKGFAVWEIADIRTYEGKNEYFEKAKVRFILSNIGRMRSGHINAKLKSNFTNSPGEHIDNIVGESSEFLEFEIWYNKCWEIPPLDVHKFENETNVPEHIINPECDYKVSKIPLGWHKFNLTLECPFCSEKVRIYYFDFCIYDETNTSREACNQILKK